MTAYRFRVKFDPDPTSLWRDVLVGADRTIDEFQSTINPAVGLDQGHLWFVGSGEDYWNSDVKYLSSIEYEDLPDLGQSRPDERTYNAGETTIAEMVERLDLERSDRICYLFDYGDEWRFYAILKEVVADASSDRKPQVVEEKGDPVEQYAPPPSEDTGPPEASDGVPPLPDPLEEFPDAVIPTEDLHALEDRDDVDVVVVLHGIETGFGRVTDRFMIQYEDAGYVLEQFPFGWAVMRYVDRGDATADELLEELVAAARDWHAEIAELTASLTGQQFDQETVTAMNDELDAELERKGYGHLSSGKQDRPGSDPLESPADPGSTFRVAIKESVFRETPLEADEYEDDPELVFRSEEAARDWIDELDDPHSGTGRLTLHSAHPNDTSGVDAYLVYKPTGGWVVDSG